MSHDLDLAHRRLAIHSVHHLQLKAERLARIVVDDLHSLGQVRGAGRKSRAARRLHIQLHVLLGRNLQFNVAHTRTRLVLEVGSDGDVASGLLVEGEADCQGCVLVGGEVWERGPAE